MMVPDPLLGTMLGKDYRVIEEIGRGGMAVVYLVEHQTLLKQFAAKVLSTELTLNREARARFTQEAHAASQLDHENIVSISDFGVTPDQRPYFVMELLRGQTLDQRVEEGPLSLEEIVAIAVPMGRALAHAHAEGVVHRDVKPENIFLVRRSQGRLGVKVVDFGIAKAPVINQKLTKMGQTLGSPMFMAPEACRGEDVDHRADIYSFGILLYLMFCGRVPFEDPSLLKVLQLQVSAPLPPPRSIKPDLAPALASMIEQALEKDPDQRFASMSELLDAFEAALPSGADRLLVEAQRGSTELIRTTPFPGVTLPSRPARTSGPSATNLPIVTSTHPVAPRSSSRRPLIIAVISVAFAALGVGFAVLRKTSEPARESGSTVAVTTPAPAVPGPAVSGSAAPGAAAPGPAAPGSAAPGPDRSTLPPPVGVTSGSDGSGSAPAPVVTKISVHVTSEPAGALVFIDRVRIGVTPVSTTIDRGSRDGELVLSRTGYKDWIKKVDLKSDIDLAASLVRSQTNVASKQAKDQPPKQPPPPPVKKGDPALDIRMTR